MQVVRLPRRDANRFVIEQKIEKLYRNSRNNFVMLLLMSVFLCLFFMKMVPKPDSYDRYI